MSRDESEEGAIAPPSSSESLVVRVGAEGLAQRLQATLTELRVQVVQDRQVDQLLASPQTQPERRIETTQVQDVELDVGSQQMGRMVQPSAEALPMHLLRHVEDHRLAGEPLVGGHRVAMHERQGAAEDQMLRRDLVEIEALRRMEDGLERQKIAVDGAFAGTVRLDVEGDERGGSPAADGSVL